MSSLWVAKAMLAAKTQAALRKDIVGIQILVRQQLQTVSSADLQPDFGTLSKLCGTEHDALRAHAPCHEVDHKRVNLHLHTNYSVACVSPVGSLPGL